MTIKEMIENLVLTLDDKGLDTDSRVFMKAPDGGISSIRNLSIGVEHEGVVICAGLNTQYHD